MGRRFIARSPGRRVPAAPLRAVVLSLCADRIRNADRLPLPSRNGLVRFGSDSGTSQLHAIDSLGIPHSPGATRLPINSQCNSYLSGDVILSIPSEWGLG